MTIVLSCLYFLVFTTRPVRRVWQVASSQELELLRAEPRQLRDWKDWPLHYSATWGSCLKLSPAERSSDQSSDGTSMIKRDETYPFSVAVNTENWFRCAMGWDLLVEFCGKAAEILQNPLYTDLQAIVWMRLNCHIHAASLNTQFLVSGRFYRGQTCFLYLWSLPWPAEGGRNCTCGRTCEIDHWRTGREHDAQWTDRWIIPIFFCWWVWYVCWHFFWWVDMDWKMKDTPPELILKAIEDEAASLFWTPVLTCCSNMILWSWFNR